MASRRRRRCSTKLPQSASYVVVTKVSISRPVGPARLRASRSSCGTAGPAAAAADDDDDAAAAAAAAADDDDDDDGDETAAAVAAAAVAAAAAAAAVAVAAAAPLSPAVGSKPS